MKICRYILISILLCSSCNKDITFIYDTNLLINKVWGIPQIIQVGVDSQDIDITAPTEFHQNGTVTFEQKYDDYWRIYDKESILIQVKSEVWQILELDSSKLHVNKYTYPAGVFIVECMYEPLKP